MSLPLKESTGLTTNGEHIDDPVFEAINHPIGHVVEALISLLFRKSRNDNDLIPEDIKEPLTRICDTSVDRFGHGRVLLSSRVISFFRVDPTWTTCNLLPNFSWDNTSEAKFAWEGFLWTPRLYQPLLTAIKTDFLKSASHFRDLGKHGEQFAALLTYAALGPIEGFSRDELRTAMSALPIEGLAAAAQALAQALEGAAERREEYWRNRVHLLWQDIWPKTLGLATPAIGASLARLAIAAGDEFPNALSDVKHWLQPVEHPDYVVHLLHTSGVCSSFPAAALQFLDLIIRDQPWPPRSLSRCLDQITTSTQSLSDDSRYQRLRNYLRQNGAG